MTELIDITCGYGGVPVLKDFTCKIPLNGVTLLTGASGSGKSTVIKLLAGVIAPMEGEVRGLLDKRLSVVFQEDRLLPWFSVRKNVALVNASGDVDRWLCAVELSEYADKKASELSGGQQRRVALARALSFGGDLLLMDEPFTGLDDALKLRVIDRLRGAFPAIVVATHDDAEAAALGADTTVRL